jgi:hypothetical protein
MRGRGTRSLAVSRRTDRSRHGFGAAEAGLRSGAPCPPSTPDLRGRRSGTATPVLLELWHGRLAADRCFLCLSPTLRPWIAGSGVLRGGALEPGALAVSEKWAGKSRTEFSTELPGPESAEEPFSLRRGLDCDQGFSRWASSFWSWLDSVQNDEGDPLGSPSLKLVCGQNASSHTSR